MIETLVAQLEAAGFSVWWDNRLRGGALYSDEIESELNSAKSVLVAWTNSSLHSRWVKDEAEAALRTNKLIPIRLDDIEPPIGFRQVQTIDFTGWKEDADHVAMQTLKQAVKHHTHVPESASQSGTVAIPEASIAVMPFLNMSPEPEQEYFSDGISEELLNLLAKVKEMQVAARTSSFSLKGSSKQVGDIGKLLGVAHILEGSVRKAGNRIRITAQLVETATGFHLWSETYDRTLDDIFAVQDEIAAAIVASLKDHILGGDKLVAPQTDRSANVDAYDRYLRGHFLIQATSLQSIELGLEDLRAAIELDPEFALPYADISDALSQMISYGLFDGQALLGEARDAAFKAVKLAPQLAQAHSALASVHQFITMDWQAADTAYETAISLTTPSPAPYHRYADYLTWTLRTEKAREMARRAREIDPRDSNSMHAEGLTALYDGDFAAAVEAFGGWNRSYPDNRWSYVKHAVALALNGQCDASFAQANAAVKLTPTPPTPPMEVWLGWTHQVCGRNEIYEECKARALASEANDAVDKDITMFYIHCIDGDVDAMVDLMQKMAQRRSPLAHVLQVPLLDHMGWAVTEKLKTNKTYKEVLRSLNFPKTKWLTT